MWRRRRSWVSGCLNMHCLWLIVCVRLCDEVSVRVSDSLTFSLTLLMIHVN